MEALMLCVCELLATPSETEARALVEADGVWLHTESDSKFGDLGSVELIHLETN
jgi:hypothetical protein